MESPRNILTPQGRSHHIPFFVKISGAGCFLGNAGGKIQSSEAGSLFMKRGASTLQLWPRKAFVLDPLLELSCGRWLSLFHLQVGEMDGQETNRFNILPGDSRQAVVWL